MTTHPLQTVLIDDGNPALSPLTDLRPAFDIRTGALTLFERIELVLGTPVSGVQVPDRLAALTRERWPAVRVNSGAGFQGKVLAINAAAACIDHPSISLLARAGDRGAIIDAQGQVVAAVVDADELSCSVLSTLSLAHTAARADVRAVMTRPWHARSCRDVCLLTDLHAIALHIRAGGTPLQPPQGATVIPHTHHALTIAPGASILPATVFDLEHGPIVIDRGACVRPGAIVIGPAYIGPNSTVLERATIRPYTSIGPWCKVNGEVGGTIFQGFANKAHDGYLGDSYIGEWVNLGAGTTNSNLLNTYGDVVCKPLTPGASNERTGEMFLGCTLGDHVKTAICTRIMTGAIVGTGTMCASSTPLAGTVPPYSWITDAGSKPFRFEKFMEVATAAMARRKLSPSPAYKTLLQELAERAITR